MTNTYDRQLPLRLTVPRRVAVIGVGGVGSWAALFLALAGVPFLDLWDADVVSDHNLNRLPLGPESIDMDKAEAMKRLLQTLRPRCTVDAYVTNFVPPADGAEDEYNPPDWLLVSTDTHASRLAIFNWSQQCRECSLSPDDIAAHSTNHPNLRYAPQCRYIEASAEGEFGGCTGEPAPYTTRLEAHPGYASVPVWVGPAVQAASLACYHILHPSALGADVIRVGWNTEHNHIEANGILRSTSFNTTDLT